MSDTDPSTVALMQAEFDAAFYLAANRDVAESGSDPFAHFLTFGWREGRDPNPHFSIRRYLDVNADVKLAGVNAFAHYVTHGRAEGRPTDHGLGFRYELLMVAPQIDERIREQFRANAILHTDPAERLADAARALEPSRPIHVTVSHDDPFGGVGGVQLCIRLEAGQMLAAGRDHLHLHPAGGGITVDIERDDPVLCVVLNGQPVGAFAHSEVARHLGPVVSARPAAFVIHSLIGHAVPPLTSTLKALGMKRGWYWLHDYSSLCASYALLRNDVAFCGAPPLSSLACEVCAYGRRRRVQASAHAALFQTFDISVAAPSRSALDLWRSRFPLSPAAAVVHPHAALVPRGQIPPPSSKTPRRPLRIAFLGMPSVHKGWPVFAELAERFREDRRYAFHHLGARQDPRVPAAFTRVAATADDPNPMARAVERLEIDVALIWSLWPETFCFAAYEALAGGAVIVTNPDAGNVADLVRGDTARGRVIADDHALAAWLDGDEAASLARSRRIASLSDLTFSGMTADLILPETAA